MAHAQKPDFVFPRNGRVHLNRRGRQFSRLLAAEVCASAVVIRINHVPRECVSTGYPLHSPVSPSLPLPCATVCHQVPNDLYCSISEVHPRTGHEGPKGDKGYSSTLSLTSELDRGGWSTPHPGHSIPGKDPVLITQEVGWAPGPVWAGVENLASTEIRSLDRPAHSESLYRLRYPGPQVLQQKTKYRRRRRTDQDPRGQPHSTWNQQRHIARRMTPGNTPYMGLRSPVAPQK